MNSMISILSALATAVWSVWTWSQEQDKQRQVKRDREAALYVNALLAATEDLQSKLYIILEEDRLAEFKKEYQEDEFGPLAGAAFMHCLSQYLGWAFRTFRYGPYTNDPQFVTLTRMLNRTLETKDFPGEAFRFTVDERVALGTAVVRRVGESEPGHPEFEAVPFYQLIDEIRDGKNKHAALYQSNAVRRSIAAIDRANGAESLEGHERLAVFQNLLVDLISYLESQEGFRVGLGERRKVSIPDSFQPSPEAIDDGEEEGSPREVNIGSDLTIVHQIPGRIRLRIARVKSDKAFVQRLQALLESFENVTAVRITAATASVVVTFSSDIPVPYVTARIAQALKTI